MIVLLISITTGYGHHATATALLDELKKRGHIAAIEDLYKYASRPIYHIMDKGYNFSTTHLPKQFGRSYDQLEKHTRLRQFWSGIYNNTTILKKLARLISYYDPDVVVTTHVFGAQALNAVKKRGYIDMPTVGIVTDYCIHPGWEELHDLDYIVTGSELLNHSAKEKGLNLERIHPLGLPVREQFRHKIEKAQARKMLGLDQDRPTLLVMSGSMGYGNMPEVISKIDAMDLDVQLACIWGNNKKLEKTLQTMETKKPLHVVGFVNNVDVYMDAADAIVTKPGGLTTTEALVKNLPMILINPIPGQEERNSHFFVNNGAAMRVDKDFSVTEAVYYLFQTQQRRALMEQSLKLLAHPRATEDICDMMEGIGPRDRSGEEGRP